MNKEIKYIGFYSHDVTEGRNYAAISAVNKMNYLSDLIVKAGFRVHIISPSWLIKTNVIAEFIHKSTININNDIRLTLGPRFGSKFKMFDKIKILISIMWLFCWLLTHVRKDEKILVYHSSILPFLLRISKKIIGFKIILEVEEIYSQVNKKDKIQKSEQILFNIAEHFIVVSEMLAETLGEKVRLIVYGNYSMAVKKKYTNPIENGKINIIYAGSIDYIKGGAFNAIKCGLFLPREYVIHICGTGNDYIIKDLESKITSINNQMGRTVCIYHGVKTGTDLTNIMFSCQIAINPQNDGDYMNSAFPSKIIFYLSHNLCVVSTRIKSIEKSPFATFISFPSNNTSESFAKEILSIDFDKKVDVENLFKALNEKLSLDLKILITE